MFILKKKIDDLPDFYPGVERVDPSLKNKGYVSVAGYVLRDNLDLIPQQGLQEEVLISECNLIFMAGSATMGKGSDYNSLIAAPTGWVKMGDLQIGTNICDTESGIQQVEDIFELGEVDLFLVKMADGSSCRCTKEHLWKYRVTKPHYKTLWEVNTLETLLSIMENKPLNNHVYIPLPKPVYFVQENDLPIDPYVLGALIGDGCFSNKTSNPHIHCPDSHILSKIEEKGYSIKTYVKCTHKVGDKKLRIQLEELGLWGKLSHQKFIPKTYKYSTIENRIEFLRGLMDTDGNVEKFHALRYSTSSEELAKDVQELVWSLGGICSINIKNPHYTYKGERREGKISYCLNINISNSDNYVTLPKKKARCKSKYRRGYSELGREIKSIEYIGKEKSRCIRVSNKNRLYITDNYIVTHNTFAGFLKALQGLGKPNYTARLISRRLQDSKKGGSIIRDAKLIYDGFAGCEFTAGEYPTASWEKWNSAIQLIHANFNTENPSEWEDYKDYCKKNQSSYIYWDELTEMRDFKAFSYMFSRNRDSSGNKPCTVASFNPEHDHWSTDFLRQAGYIGDDWYAIPEKYGTIKYFVIQGDTIKDIVFGDSPEEVVRKAGIVVTKEEKAFGMTAQNMVKSFTFLSGTAMSNKILVNATEGGSVANLYNVGETERKKIKDGYFGYSEKNELTVSRKMIEMLWENPIDISDDTYGTLDVSSGNVKADNCMLWIWKGMTAIALERYEGDLKELVPWVQDKLAQYRIPTRNLAFDAVSIGYYLQSFIDGMPVIGNSRPVAEYDSHGNQIHLGSHFNLRTQLMSKTRTLLEIGAYSCTIEKDKLYPDGKNKTMKCLIDIMLEQINLFSLMKKGGKNYYKSKDEYIAKFKSSPDIMDAFILRAIFELDMRPRKETEKEYEENDYADLYMEN